jgi:hypothetical protein
MTSFLHHFSFNLSLSGAEMTGLESLLCASSMRKGVKEIINKDTGQYIATLIIAIYACFCLYQFHVSEQNVLWINYFSGIVLIYLSIHLFFVEKIELKIHHILFIFVVSWFFLCQDNENGNGDAIKNELMIIILAEISNIFLSIRNLIRDPSIVKFVSLPAFCQPLNDILFALSFFYARIYMYFKHIIVNPAFFESISNYNRFYMCDKIVIAISFAVFILNMYWFGLICNGFIKMVWGTKNEDPILTQIALIREKMGYI